MKELPLILIVDDEPENITVLSHILSGKYQLKATRSGERALAIASQDIAPDLILLDIMMPDMDGYEVLDRLRKIPSAKNIPVIIITALTEDVDETKGLELGANDYINKPVRPEILIARINTQLLLKQARDFLNDKNSFLEKEISKRMKENLLIQNVSIRALAHLAETRDPDTGDHILRTQAYVELLARKLKELPKYSKVIDEKYISLVTRSAPLHDIGKVGIPDTILLKPGKLNDSEWTIMKTHAELGARAIEQTEMDLQQPIEFLILAKEIAHRHHEKWDGSGYPGGLSGEEIPLSARLMAIADVFDALISPRVYKKAMSYNQAKEIILEGKGKHFDPDVTDIFNDNFLQFVEIAEKYQNDNNG